MAFTYSKLAEVTVGSGGASSIDFNNIPQNYNDLVILTSLRSSTSDSAASLRFNSTTTNLSDRVIFNSSGTAGSNTDSQIRIFSNRTNATNVWSNTSIYIPNYNSFNLKSVSIDQVNEENNSNTISTLSAALWSNNTAIVSIRIQSAVNFVQHSTATLYGVKAEV